MNSKRNALKLTQFIMQVAAFFSLFIVVAAAENNTHHFDELVQINHPQADFTHWQQLVVNPSNNQQYFVINTTGQMFLVDDMKNASQILDLHIMQQEVHSPLKLTAIELHPNFALRDQPGYGTFYTAHLETIDTQSKTKRIQENNDELTLKFDSVITEWQFNSINYQKVDLESRREVLRIGVPSDGMTIQQMSFSPYAKSWNDGFGLLYIALNGEEKRQEPLYSGVILRINPAKFGLRSFTVPNSNPYVKNHDIRDEIYLLGAQKIQQFIWSDKSSNNLLLSHQYEDKFLLSLINIKGDWRKKAPNNIIYQSDNPIGDILKYRGRNMPHLHNKLLMMIQVNQTWFVKSLKIKLLAGSDNANENIPEIEWQFNPEQLTNESDISFGLDFNSEVLVLDRTTGSIFKLPQESTVMKTPLETSITPVGSQEESNNNIAFLLVFLFIMSIFIYFIKRNTTSAKAIVRTRYAQLELSESQHQIGLYHRHKNSPELIMDIIDIEKCEVMLNDHPICVINRQVGHGFDDDKDQDLRAIFTKEKVDKMIDGKIRQMALSFTDVKNRNYVVCLYMRKGSDRVTKKSYSIVVEDLIDWCWLIASKLNPNETKIRKEKPIVSSNPSIDSIESKHGKLSLHEQAEINRQAVRTAPIGQQQTTKETSDEAPVSNGSNARINQKSVIDTDLVDALEKLVDLKQQGFLTEEEFTVAKENLLSSLFDK